ncbi:MAG: hypothetical protein IJ222_10505 [Bacteroidales bacterium]|nr:hypothetical protein [Bacteroidales bacterium]
MKLRDLFRKKTAAPEAASTQVMSPVQSLYEELTKPEYESSTDFCTEDLGEDMALVKESIYGWWKPRFLLDHRSKEAIEFLDRKERFIRFSEEDVDWESIRDVPADAYSRAKDGNAGFPTIVCRFEDGIAEVRWQINPDGYYYMDEDGYGMTDDEEIELVGAIDRTGKIVKRFTLRKT